MTDSLDKIATDVLTALAEAPRDEMGGSELGGTTLSELTNRPPSEINDGVALLVERGYAEWHQVIGTAPFRFKTVGITPRGRYEQERFSSTFDDASVASRDARPTEVQRTVTLPAAPVGSPYGFTDEDWEFIAERKATTDKLMVTLGYQFDSEHYDSQSLVENIHGAFDRAVTKYNQSPTVLDIELVFSPLAAGYGEHLFNEIARDIIGSDITVFETSDQNPNVMLEMGVALTWGTRVLPIKKEGMPRPPSDISGQTWVDYTESASEFVDPGHEAKLVRMIERAVRKKA